MPAETYQNKYNMVFHENANCTVMNDVQFHQPVTIVSGDKTFLNETEMTSREEEEKEEKDELTLLLRDEELYKDIVYWASTCKKAKDIRERIVEPLRRKGHKYFDKNFVKSLLPFLINYEGSKNLDTLMKQIY